MKAMRQTIQADLSIKKSAPVREEKREKLDFIKVNFFVLSLK
jgi:hypothetical protein